MKISVVITVFLVLLANAVASAQPPRKVYKWPGASVCQDINNRKYRGVFELACLIQQEEWRMLHFAALGGAIGNGECDRLWDHYNLMHGYLRQYDKLYQIAFGTWSREGKWDIPSWKDRLEMRLPSELNPACRSP
jgi:hypothetical protein